MIDLTEIFKRNEKSFLGVGRWVVHMQSWKHRAICPHCNGSGMNENGDCVHCGMNVGIWDRMDD